MKKTLFTWIGKADRNAVKNADTKDPGPIARTVGSIKLDRLVALSDYDNNQKNEENKLSNSYLVDWVREHSKTDLQVDIVDVFLPDPTNYKDIYDFLVTFLEDDIQNTEHKSFWHFLLNPGTPPMAAIWLLLSKSRYQNTILLDSSREHGVKIVDLPFDISIDNIDDTVLLLSHSLPPVPEVFKSIIHNSTIMKHKINEACNASCHSKPVLLLGESGTGKELFAECIHKNSKRAAYPLIAVNCGAISHSLFESELFGYKKGSHSEAKDHKIGYVEKAGKGTLFLDEVGDLPLDKQVVFLRLLQENKFRVVGDENESNLESRIIAATNINLKKAVNEGKFREDLYYRLFVDMIVLPPLRERKRDDLPLLVEFFISEINRDLKSENEENYLPKMIDDSGLSSLQCYYWPGNIRELKNVLERSMIKVLNSKEPVIPKTIIEDQINNSLSKIEEDLSNRSFDNKFDINELVDDVKKCYIKKALSESNNIITDAAKLLNLSQPNLTQWCKKYGIKL